MARKKTPAALTPHRAARLYRLLTLLAGPAKPRRTLLSRLKLDLRGFYRDVETLRALGIEVTAGEGSVYQLDGELDDALARLPFPDPGLSVRDALQLSAGATVAHRNLGRRVTEFLRGPAPKRAKR